MAPRKKVSTSIPWYAEMLIGSTRVRVVDRCSCCGHVLKTTEELLSEDELADEIRQWRDVLTKQLEQNLRDAGISDYQINHYRTDFNGGTIKLRAQAMNRWTKQPIIVRWSNGQP